LPSLPGRPSRRKGVTGEQPSETEEKSVLRPPSYLAAYSSGIGCTDYYSDHVDRRDPRKYPWLRGRWRTCALKESQGRIASPIMISDTGEIGKGSMRGPDGEARGRKNASQDDWGSTLLQNAHDRADDGKMNKPREKLALGTGRYRKSPKGFRGLVRGLIRRNRHRGTKGREKQIRFLRQADRSSIRKKGLRSELSGKSSAKAKKEESRLQSSWVRRWQLADLERRSSYCLMASTGEEVSCRVSVRAFNTCVNFNVF